MPRLAPDAQVTLVETLDDVLDMRTWLGERRDWLGVDLETTGFNLGRDRVRLAQLGDLTHGWALPWDGWKGAFRESVEAYRREVVFHNATFDWAFLEREGVRVRQELVHDTMVMAHLVNPASRIGLKPTAARLVGPEALLGKDALDDAFKAGGWDYATIPIDHPAYWTYSAMDTMLTAAIAGELWPEVERDYARVYDVEMGSIRVLVPARLRGMAVDVGYAHRTRSQFLSDMERLRGRVPVDPGKDRQVRDLFDGLGREMGRGPLGSWWPFRTDKGEVSVDDDALKYFQGEFPDLIPPLRGWRKRQRMVSAYLNNILELNVDGVLRCSIKQVGARTGRMSITEPALQTLPRGRHVRDAFVAREGHRLLLADYSQAEARVFASLAGCRAMIDSFLRGEDQHTWVAALCYHYGGDEAAQALVTKIQRQISKNVGYANIYGAGDEKIAATASDAADEPVGLDVIRDFKARYNEIFPEVEAFKQRILAEMHRRKRDEGSMYVRTQLGRRLVVDPDKPYTAFNYLVQPSATADVLKLKLCEMDAAGLGDYILLPVHDEVLMEVPDGEVDDAREAVRRVMPERDMFECPLEIETDVVDRWGDHYRDYPDTLAEIDRLVWGGVH